MKSLTVKLTLIEEMLGTAPANEDIFREYIASKSPNVEETADKECENLSIDEQQEKAMTIFPKRADGTPIIYDYQIRGFFKEIAGSLKKVKEAKSASLKAHKKQIDNLIFCEPREIPIDLNGLVMGTCERSLRAETAQGARTALAKSETIPAGATIEFTVVCMVDSDIELVKEWLGYGKWKGLGQWRNSGKGRFEYEVLNESASVKGV